MAARRSSALQILTPASSPSIPPSSRLYLSHNGKTGVSLNFDIAATCTSRTAACNAYCYGNSGPIAFPKSKARYVANVERARELVRATPAELLAEATQIYHGVRARGQDFLRINGVGDLTEGVVRLTNTLARKFPDLRLWVSTRNVTLAQKLVYRDNLHVMVSIDNTTPGEAVHAAYEFVRARAPMAYGAWVQQTAADRPPDWVSVIFAIHRSSSRAPWATRATSDGRTCPATLSDGASHEGACAACRFCFDRERRTDLAYLRNVLPPTP